MEGKLSGTWKGSDFMFVKTAGPDVVATVNGGLGQHVRSTLLLKADGTYEMLVAGFDNGKGNWEVKDDELITTSENGNKVFSKLLKVTEDELITIQKVSMDTPEGELQGNITKSYTKVKK